LLPQKTLCFLKNKQQIKTTNDWWTFRPDNQFLYYSAFW
jgi:hypothetical protein